MRVERLDHGELTMDDLDADACITDQVLLRESGGTSWGLLLWGLDTRKISYTHFASAVDKLTV